MGLADVIEARRQAQASTTSIELVPAQPPALDADGRRLGAASAPALSQDAQKVLQDAWLENQMHAYGAPIDTADLLIGLLRAPKTGVVLEHFGITVDRIRTAKGASYGYQLATRFSTVSDRKLAKTQQVGRVARLVTEYSIVSGKELIEPEDILEILAVDGLGWGTDIMEELGLNEELLCEGLSNVQMLGDGMFGMSADLLARQNALDASGLRSWRRPAALAAARERIAPIGRFVGRLLTL
jgi:hypothetical protein